MQESLLFEFDTSDVTAEELDRCEEEEAEAAPPPTQVASQLATPAKYLTRTGADLSRILFLDIETAPHPDRIHLADSAEAKPAAEITATPEEVLAGTVSDVEEFLKLEPPNEFLDRLLAAENARDKPRSSVIGPIQKLKGARVREHDARIKSYSTNPAFCRIVAFGWTVGMDEPDGVLAMNEDEERAMLERFWELVERHTIVCGYYHTGFDLPVLCIRSALLGIEPRRMFDLPHDKSCLDLCAKLNGKGGKAPRLKEAATLFGLPVQAEGVDGSQVAELIQSDPQLVLKYVKSDVDLLRSLFLKFSGYFWL